MRFLLKFSVIYLLLPNILFFYYWIFSPLNIVICLVMLALTIQYFREVQKTIIDNDTVFFWQELIIIITIGFVWTIFSGVGAFTYQSSDFYIQHAKFYNLYNADWPLKYDFNNKPLIYYWGYYLVPIFISKQIHQFSNTLIVVWTMLGFSISFAWIFILLKKSWIKIVLLLIIGCVGQFINYSILYNIFHIDFPKALGTLMSLYEQSTWVPNQIIPAIIVTSIFLFITENKIALSLLILPLSLIFVWCVFPTFILILITIIWVFYSKNYNQIVSLITQSILPFIFIFFPLLLFYISSNGGGISGFVWKFNSPNIAFFDYLRQLVPDLLFILFIIFTNQYTSNRNFTIYITILTLCLGIYRIGFNNDLFHRSSIVLYFIIFVNILQNTPVKNIFRNKYFIIFIIFSSIYPLKEVLKRLRYNVFTSESTRYSYGYFTNKTIYEGFLKFHTKEEALQYSAKENSPYEKYLAPKR